MTTGYARSARVNLAALAAERAAESPERIALQEAFGERRTLSWSGLDAAADRFAGGMSGLGLVAGHRVAIALTNRLEFVVAYLGSVRAGLVAVPVNPRAATGEMVRMLADSGSRIVVAGPTTAPRVREAVNDLAHTRGDIDLELPERTPVQRVVVVDAVPVGDEIAWSQLLDQPAGPVVSPADPEALAVLLYTSGTSGSPRAAMLRHRSLLANIEQASSIEPPPVRPDDVVLGLLPLFHVYGLNCILGLTLATGARLVLVERFDPDGTLELIRDLGVTNVPVAPPVIAAWSGREQLRESLGGVRLVLSGAGPLDSSLAEEFVDAAGVPIEQGYGLTETSPIVTSTLTSSAARAGAKVEAGSVGGPIPGVEIRILDVTGHPARPGDPGEIGVRGDNVFSGYWPDGAEGPAEDGWYATGDVGLIGPDGDLFLVDRLRELVIVSGFNVYPSEVEDVVAEVSGVGEVAVIGVPDPDTGEAVVVLVVADGADRRVPDLVDAIRHHCERRLARFKWPREITVVEGLPHSATGKVAKGRLRAQARRDALGLS
ncbi:MAG: class I adenylate-forming enzyme family protein [Nocardioidaceae bacterium]